MPPPSCKLTTAFVAARCGDHDVQNDQTLKPAVIQYVPPTSRAFDVLVMTGSHIGAARSDFQDMSGADEPIIPEPSSPAAMIASLVLGVVIPDLATNGTSLKLARCRGVEGSRGEVKLCAPISSGHGIVGIHRVLLPTRLAGEKAPREEADVTGLGYLLVDAIGNVYTVRNVLDGSINSALPVPELIVKACDQEPSASHPHLSSAACDPVPAGTPSPGGWVGVAFPSFMWSSTAHAQTTIHIPNATTSTAAIIDCVGFPSLSVGGSINRHPYFAIGREYGKDVRIAEFINNSWSVSAMYNCIHSPTSLVFAGSNDEVLAIADGPLLTVADVDIRTNTPAGTSYFAATPRTLCHPLSQPKSLVWSVVSLVPVATPLIKWALDKDAECSEQLAASKGAGPRAPPSTELRALGAKRAAYKALSQVLPNCIVVASSDRSITVLDVRKWTKVGSVHNVLKYDALTASVVLVPGDRDAGGPEEALLSLGCVVSGIDSEVRCVPCLEGSSVAHSLHQQAQAPNKKGAANGKIAGTAGAPTPQAGADENLPAVSSFRGRINTAIHGEDMWHGGWHPILIPSNASGDYVRASVGLTATMQVYFAVAEHTTITA